jgi:hypothetical protein
MTIDPKDLRTLLIRVTAITLAVRLVPLIGQDLGVHEAALALGLGDAGHEPWPLLTRGLLLSGGGFSAFARLIPLVCDVATPALAVAFARAAGWGAIPGLLAGLLLAMGPLGLDMGERADGVALGTVAALGALALLRAGLRDGDWQKTALSALPIVLVGPLAPSLLLLVPGGLYMALRAVAGNAPKRAGLATWLAAAVAVVGVRLGVFGALLPHPPLTAAWWLGTATMDPSGWAETPPWQAAGQALAAVLPSGTQGALARQLDLQAASLPALVLGGGLVLTALAGLWRGRVRPDPIALPPSEQTGWQTVGVHVSVPRDLGDRDLVPLALPLLLVLGFAAWSAWRGQVDGLTDALAVARTCAVLLVGVGLSARAMPRSAKDDAPSERRAAWQLAATALVVFGIGASHLLVQTQGADRQSARKVARFAHENLGQKGALLALGGRGVPVLFLLDPHLHEKRFAWSSLDPGEALEQLTTILAQHPDSVVLVGDRDALGPTDEKVAPREELETVWQFLLPTLNASGWQQVDDSHRFLGHTAVLTFMRQEAPQIRPQLLPGQAP